MVLCCLCGVDITGPSAGARCVQCLHREVDITEGISRRLHIQKCGTCSRYLKQTWMVCEPESRELLGVCLHHIKGLTREHKLVDANFVYTEPHSKELKVKITLQREAIVGVVVQQSVTVEFRVDGLQCTDCQKSFTSHTWESCVQVRQRAEHRRTLLALEQVILKNGAHKRVLGLEQTKDGMDFLFKRHCDALSFVAFVKTCAMLRHQDSKQLISHNQNNCTYRYKRTVCVELCPVCREDLVHLPTKIAQSFGGLPPLMLCTRVASSILLVDPASCRSIEISAVEYWKRSFLPVCTSKRLTEFMVLDVIVDDGPGLASNKAERRRLVPCEVEIARMSDFGHNDERIVVRSHLGGILAPGDIALGYDLRTMSTGLDELVPPLDVYLVRRQQQKRDAQVKTAGAGTKKCEDMEKLERIEGEETSMRAGQIDVLAQVEGNDEEDPTAGTEVVEGDENDEEKAEIMIAADRLFRELEGDNDVVAASQTAQEEAGGSEPEEMQGNPIETPSQPADSVPSTELITGSDHGVTGSTSGRGGNSRGRLGGRGSGSGYHGVQNDMGLLEEVVDTAPSRRGRGKTGARARKR